MKKIKTTIEYYSYEVADDIILTFDVEYIIDNDTFSHEFGNEIYGDYVSIQSAQLLNTNLSDEMLNEIEYELSHGLLDDKLADSIGVEI